MKISDVFNVSSGKRIIESEIYKNKGNLPCITAQTENNGITWFGDESYLNEAYPNTIIDEECITWSKDGYAGKMFFRNYKFYPNDHCGVLILKKEWRDKINYKWFIYKYQKYIMSCSNQQGSQPMLYNKEMANIELIYKIPSIDEQNKIVELYEKLETYKNTINQNIQKIETTINELLSLKNTKDFIMNDIALLNKGSNKISEESIYQNYDANGIPVYSSATENKGLIGKVSKSFYDSLDKKGNKGELTWTTNGYAGVVFYRDTNYLYSEKCGRIQIRKDFKDLINPKFLMYQLNTITYKYKTSESNNGKLDIIHMKHIPIKLPVENNKITIEIQNRAVEQYEKLETMKKDLLKTLNEIDNLL